MFSKTVLKILKHGYTSHWRRSLSAAKTAEKRSFNKMQAWQIHSYGDLSELQLTDARIPHILEPTDLLIKVGAASVNPIDTDMIKGYGRTVIGVLRGIELELPLTLGRDFAGIIMDKGYGVSNKFKIGDKVYGVVPVHKQGSHAQIVLANQSHILPHPTHLQSTEATSVLYTALTAWSALFLTGELIVRDPRLSKILILGASGGVGTMALQLLKSQNATVMGTCATDAVPLVTSLGADNVFDYTNENYVQNVAAEGKFDIILDCAKFGYQNISKTWDHNMYITLNAPLLVNTDKYGLLGGLATSVRELLCANVTKFSKGKSVRWAFFLPSSDGLRFIDGLVKTKQIIPSIHKVFKFSELPKAYEAMIAGHLRGKIVIDMES